MKFEEIFNEEGLYKSESFVKGFCFQIKKNSITNSLELYSLTYRNLNDILPYKDQVVVYSGLFKKEYTKVFTRESLFK